VLAPAVQPGTAVSYTNIGFVQLCLLYINWLVGIKDIVALTYKTSVLAAFLLYLSAKLWAEIIKCWLMIFVMLLSIDLRSCR
jgi:hypothetical protein